MNKCLVIKLGALGDVVMSTALVDAIRRHHAPDTSLSVLTTPAFAPLFERMSGVTLAVFPRRGLRATVDVLQFLRRERFDRIYDLQGNDRTQFWCAASGARERVGNHNRYPYTHHPASRWRGQSHIFERLRETLASAGVVNVSPRPVLPADDAVRARVQTWLSSHGLEPGRFALLHAGASERWPSKRWPYFAGLAERLGASGIDVAWIGAEPDRAANAALAARYGVDATAAFDVTELAEAGRHARFAVTNDSGPMHVLSASGIPVFGLFGPSNWRRNHAVGQGERVIACVDVDPAHHGAAAADCLASVSVEAVWARLAAEGLTEA